MCLLVRQNSAMPPHKGRRSLRLLQFRSHNGRSDLAKNVCFGAMRPTLDAYFALNRFCSLGARSFLEKTIGQSPRPALDATCRAV
jgi:hypothetical protein